MTTIVKKSMLDGSDLDDETSGQLQEHFDKTGGMAADFGGRPMAPGENMAADQAAAAQAQQNAALNAALMAASADQGIGQMLRSLQGHGSLSMYAQQARKKARSVSERMLGGEEPKEPPIFPGGVYIAHLAKRINAIKKDKARKKEPGVEDQPNIYCDHMGALKAAIQAMGIYSDKNPGGLPVDIKDARKVWFGSKAPEKYEEAEWRSLVEMGDTNLDMKKVRKFVNYDGSATWEVLNEDKTVASRFTLGEYKGTKVFTQGGYNKFAEVLKKIKSGSGSAGFDDIQGLMGGMNG